jgi:hypothetical protein
LRRGSELARCVVADVGLVVLFAYPILELIQEMDGLVRGFPFELVVDLTGRFSSAPLSVRFLSSSASRVA